MWFWVLVVVLAIAAITVLLVGSGSTLSDVYEDRPDRTIPVGRPLTADDLSEIRFTTAMRGYRMDEVDALVDRLRADLLQREAAATRTEATAGAAAVTELPPAGAWVTDVPSAEAARAEEPLPALEPAVQEDDAPDPDIESTAPIPVVGADRTDPLRDDTGSPGGSTGRE
jgi:DivIVA domain-containing protein